MGTPMQLNQDRSTRPPAYAGRTDRDPPGFPSPFDILESIDQTHDADMAFDELLLVAARRIQDVEGDVSARLLFATGSIDFDAPTREALALAATTMIAGAIRRLHGVRLPELHIFMKNHGGEIRFSAIDNSACLPSETECALVRRRVVPLGGLHACERQGSLVESAFCFLDCRLNGWFSFSGVQDKGYPT